MCGLCIAEIDNGLCWEDGVEEKEVELR